MIPTWFLFLKARRNFTYHDKKWCILQPILCSEKPEVVYFMNILYVRKALGSLVQDGGVDRQALTPSWESTGFTTNCWTIINRKTLELTKKDTSHPETKEKLQWDGRRGVITIKSHPITTEWVTHKLENAYTTEVHPLEWRFWAPCQASQPGGLVTEGGIPRESDLEG